MLIPARMTRRQMLRLSAGSLLAAGFWPGQIWARDGDSGKSFRFFVVNDLHYHDEQCTPWFEKLIEQMKAAKEKVDFCLVVGDLVEDGKPAQFEPIHAVLKKLGLPFYVVVGNHDHGAGDSRKAYDEAFPRSLNYTFDHGGWQFLALDSSQGRKAYVTVQQPTLDWLDKNLPSLDKKKPLVLFTHFPFGPLTPYRVKNAAEILERFKEYNLQVVYNGHFHGFTERKIGATILTTNRCCSHYRKNHDGTKEKGYFLCHAKDGKIERTFIEAQMA